ncbi:MAG TPA: formimidoylglutamate deiminase [Terracidiphilus sp.]|nr:formimidoylglutamate deiminase [Terracidiphilus sp.]
MKTLYRPDLLYANGEFLRHSGLLAAEDGRILAITQGASKADAVVDLPGRALLPGFVNAHSHAFQRLIRGKAESRVASGNDFWSWRGTMYRAAAHLDPTDVYGVARMAFLEMALSGITTVGEFHYLHNAPDGKPYGDPNLLAKRVIAAAQSVGIRIVLLRAAYLRSGFELPRDPGQARFFESAAEFNANLDSLTREYPTDSNEVRLGIAPHSIRAVPLDALRKIVALGRSKELPIHMHISEQPAENEACVREYGATPVALLANAGLLGPDWTAVHAIHVDDREKAILAAADLTVCSCPTTERNLGDGILEAGALMESGLRIALGSDSQAQIDPLEDARELDYHLRLVHRQRAMLDQIGEEPIAARLFACATIHGAHALQVEAGDLAAGSFADFFTVDLRDPSIAGHPSEDLLPLLVFGLNRTAIRDVAVNGRLIVRDGRHALGDEILTGYADAHERIWRTPKA